MELRLRFVIHKIVVGRLLNNQMLPKFQSFAHIISRMILIITKFYEHLKIYVYSKNVFTLFYLCVRHQLCSAKTSGVVYIWKVRIYCAYISTRLHLTLC